jgi:hypothetical protein
MSSVPRRSSSVSTIASGRSTGPKARAAANSPEGVAQRFLERHFNGDMGFWPSALELKRRSFSKALAAKIDAYFARIADADEAPEINGDLFSDVQNYPARFVVDADGKTKTGVIVPVRFAVPCEERNISYVLGARPTNG